MEENKSLEIFENAPVRKAGKARTYDRKAGVEEGKC